MVLGRQDLRIGNLALCLLGALGLIVLAARPAAAAAPGSATLVAPYGALTGTTISFTWAKSGGGATWYLLEVDDSTGVKFLRWYTAAQAGCAGGEETCAVTVSQGLAPGPAGWWVRPWNSEGYGPWSGGMAFTLSVLPPTWAATLPTNTRFTLVMGGAAVLDLETGLVWEQNPSPSAATTWDDGFAFCWGSARFTGGRYGWRLPTVEELTSLLNPATRTLPGGHPFGSNTSGTFWTGTTVPNPNTSAYTVNFSGSGLGATPKTMSTLPVWCVRGGMGNRL